MLRFRFKMGKSSWNKLQFLSASYDKRKSDAYRQEVGHSVSCCCFCGGRFPCTSYHFRPSSLNSGKYSLLSCQIRLSFLPLSLSLSTRRPHFNDFTLSSPRLIAICLFLLFRIGREQKKIQIKKNTDFRSARDTFQAAGSWRSVIR